MAGSDGDKNSRNQSVGTKDPCKKCNKPVKRAEKGLQCEYCAEWIHITCEGITVQDYDFIMKRGKQLHWFRGNCNVRAIDVLKLFNNMKNENEAMKNEISEISNKVERITELEEPGMKQAIANQSEMKCIKSKRKKRR